MNCRHVRDNRRAERKRKGWEEATCTSRWAAWTILEVATLSIGVCALVVSVPLVTLVAGVLVLGLAGFLFRDLRTWIQALEYRSAKLALITQARRLPLHCEIEISANGHRYSIAKQEPGLVDIVRFDGNTMPLPTGFTGQVAARVFFFSPRPADLVNAIDTQVKITGVSDGMVHFSYDVDAETEARAIPSELWSASIITASVVELLELAHLICYALASPIRA